VALDAKKANSILVLFCGRARFFSDGGKSVKAFLKIFAEFFWSDKSNAKEKRR
jgi:hypothetical protein